MIKIFTPCKRCFQYFKLTILFIAFLFLDGASFAEGTKQLRPTENDKGYIGHHSNYNDFAQYGCLQEERLHIKICNIGEVIYYGMQSWEEDGRRWQLRDPDGNIVVTDADIPKSTADIGYIDTYNQAISGPEQIVQNGTGYNAIHFTNDW